MTWQPIIAGGEVIQTKSSGEAASAPNTLPPSLGNRVTASEGRLDLVEAEVDALDVRLTTAESDILALDVRLNTAELDIIALEAADVALDGRVDTAEADIIALEAVDVAYDTRLDALEALNPRVIDVNDTTAGLRVTQRGAGPAILVEDTTNVDASPFTVDQFGQVGIGTAAPVSTVDISSDGVMQVTAGRHDNTGNPARYAARKSQGTRAAPTIVATDSLLYEYAFRGYDSVDYRDAALLIAQVDGVPAAGSMPGLLSFRTTPTGSTTPVENYRITSAGLSVFAFKFGYGLGAGTGGTVTQITSKATGVTLNACTGRIVMEAGALAAGARASFIVTNNRCELNDNIIIHRMNGGSANAYRCWIDEIAAGSFRVVVENYSAGSLSEAVALHFTIIRGLS